ncbi:hypothetical protein ABVT39_006677 [Epinephelus coioides]
MYRPYLHSADCPIGKQLNLNLLYLHREFGSVHADQKNHRKTSPRSQFFINAASCSQAAGTSQTLEVNAAFDSTVSRPDAK